MSGVTQDRIVYIGFGKNVIAFDRTTGDVCWSWKSPRAGTAGAVSLLLERDVLVVSISGYLWGLDPFSGEELWHNPLKGMGIGVPMMVSASQVGGSSAGGEGVAAAAAAGASG